MGFTYYIDKAIKVCLILIGMTLFSSLMLYSLVSGYLEQTILGMEMSLASAMTMGGLFLGMFIWSLFLIGTQLTDISKDKRLMSEFDDLLDKEIADKVREIQEQKLNNK